MTRVLPSIAFLGAAFALTAPMAHADIVFDLEMASNGFGGPTGSGTIALATDPGNGTFAFTAYNPVINFFYSPYTFTQNDIYDPANAYFTLSDFNGRRRFQFDDSQSPVFFDVDRGNGNYFEVAFRPDTYGDSSEVSGVDYSALSAVSADVPEPGSMVSLATALLVGIGFLRRRRASAS